MTHTEIDQVAEAAAERAVAKTFLSLGVDITDPKSVIRFHNDLLFLTSWRESSQAVTRKALLTIVGVVITGLLGFVAIKLGWHK